MHSFRVLDRECLFLDRILRRRSVGLKRLKVRISSSKKNLFKGFGTGRL